MGTDLAQAEHGGQDPIGVGELVLGARTACPAAFAAPSLVAEPLALSGQRRDQIVKHGVHFRDGQAGQLRVPERGAVEVGRSNSRPCGGRDGCGVRPRAGSGRDIGGMERVIPVSVEAVPAHRQGVDLGVGDLDPGVAGAGVEFGLDPEPGAGGGCDGVAMTSWLVSGLPRQFMEMRGNSRCST